MSLAHEIQHRCDLALIHCLHGEILLKRNPANPNPTEEALQATISAAKE